MAVTLDAVGGGTVRSGSINGVTGFSYTGLTVGASLSNGALGVMLMFDVAGVNTVAVSWDSAGTPQTMTSIGSVSTPGGRLVQCFGLVNPTSGNKTLKVTWNSITAEVYVAAVSWSGVNQTGGATTFPHFNSQSTTSAVPSVNITSAIGNAVMGCHEDDNAINSMSGTAIWTIDNSGPAIAAAASRYAGAGTVTVNANLGAAADCGTAGFDILAASGGSPVGIQTTNLPFRGFVYSEWQKWLEPGNVQLPSRDLTKPSAKPDFPNPYPIYWYRSYESIGNSLRTVPNNPFFQTDWPNPQRIVWYKTWTQSFQQAIPFNQNNWPVSRTNPPLVQTWSQSLNLFYQSETFPFVQSDYPNPQRITWYRSIEDSGNSLTTVVTVPFSQLDWPNPQRIVWDRFWSRSPSQPAPGTPFFQTDWSLPRTYQPIQQSWAVAGNVQPPFPTPFFQNVDAPLPVVSQPIDQTWLQSLVNFYQANTFPFVQSNYPNPYPVYWYRDHNQNLVLYLPVGEKPFNQSDWPLIGSPKPIDQFYYQALVLNLPEPPPPEIITSAGRWISPEEVISSIARKYGSIGGLASANSRTAAERSLLASIAAAHRWKK